MNKKSYEQAGIEIIRFEKKDVIVASGNDHYIDDKGNNDTEIM